MTVAFYAHDFGPQMEHVAAVARGADATVLAVDTRMPARERLAAMLELLTEEELEAALPLVYPC